MNQTKYIQAIGLHILIGIIIYQFEFLSKVYFVTILLFFLRKIFFSKNHDKTYTILLACSYIVGSEVFLRMTDGSFLHEISKYTVIVFLFIGIFFNGFEKKAFKYLIYLVFLIPGILVSVVFLDFDISIRKAIAFNLSGPVCLGIAAIYCYNKRVSHEKLTKLLNAMLYPLITTTTYLFLYTPSIKDVLSGTQSNFEASGGFGPNQVATVLGLAIFILSMKLFIGSRNIIVKGINLVVLIAVSFRAIVTFSRGGVIVALLMIMGFLFIYYLKSSSKYKYQLIGSLFVFMVAVAITWTLSSSQTRGLIDKRYANENAQGIKKEDLTTGRISLFSYEFKEFLGNPFFGIGVGNVKYKRKETIGHEVASHNEMSRILAEHGFFGIIAFSILLLAPLAFRIKHKNSFYFYSFYIFWLLTVNHSSMRIAAPAFIYGLCLLNVTYEKPIIHR